MMQQAMGIASTSTSLVHLSTTRHSRSWSRRGGALLIVVSPHGHGRCSGSIYARRRRRLVAVCQQRQQDPPEEDGDKNSEERSASTPGGHLVDENMLTLRRRIGEIREVVGGLGGVDDHHRAVGAWSKKATKKHRVTLYRTDMLELLALMQLDLQRKREDGEVEEEGEGDDSQHRRPLPAKIGVGLTLMVTVTVPVSVIVIALHLMDAAKIVIDGIHGVQSLHK